MFTGKDRWMLVVSAGIFGGFCRTLFFESSLFVCEQCVELFEGDLECGRELASPPGLWGACATFPSSHGGQLDIDCCGKGLLGVSERFSPCCESTASCHHLRYCSPGYEPL